MAAFMLILPVLTGGILIAMVFYVDKQRKKDVHGKKKSLIPTAFYMRAYRIIDNSFLTRGGFRKIVERISGLSIYNAEQSRIVSVKFYVISLLYFWGLAILGWIIFKDFFTVLVIALFALVVRDSIVFKKIDAIQFKVLKDMRVAISSVRQNYMRLGSIADAVGEAEVPSLLTGPFDDIFNILTSVDADKRIDEFYAKTPFKLLQTFAGVSYILNDAGDTKDENGASNYIEALSMMASEIDLEIRRVTLMKAKFGVLEYLPVAPIFAMGLIEWFFASNIPGTSIMYKGTYGYVARVIIVLASMLGYWVIVKINSVVTVKTDDRNALVKELLKIPWFDHFITTIEPKKLARHSRKSRMIKNALSSRNVHQMYASKVLFATFAFIFTLFICIMSVELGKSFTYNNVQSLSLIGGENLTARDVAIRQKVDAAFLALPKRPSRQQAEDVVRSKIPNVQTLDKDEQADRLLKKYDAYHDAYFKWWMLLICYAVAYLGWNEPEIALKARKWILKTESEEDILQLQTLLSILMNTNFDTMDALFWMQRQSRVHKNALIDCYQEYPSNPEMSLERLKNNAPSVEFRRMIDKLQLTVHQISLKDAFSDLANDRDHMLRVREIAQTSSIGKKRVMASPLSLFPLILVLILYILVPIGVLGWQEFTSAIKSAGLH